MSLLKAAEEGSLPTKRDSNNNNNNMDSFEKGEGPINNNNNQTSPNRQDDSNVAAVAPTTTPTTTSVVLTKEELRANRTFMTIVHFLLTYPRWSFTLFLLLASTSFPRLPAPSQAVLEPLRILRDLAKTESRLYHECTVHAFDSMTLVMNETATEQYQLVTEQHQRNQDVIYNQARQLQTQCSEATTLARRALQEWQRPDGSTTTAAPAIPIKDQDNNNNNSSSSSSSNNNASCTATDLAKLSQVFGTNVTTNDDGDQVSTAADNDDITDNDSIVGSVLDDYLVASHKSLTRVAAYTRDRARYDYNYFVGVKIQASVNVLDQYSLSPPPAISLTLPEQEILVKLRVILQSLLDVIASAKVRIDILLRRLGDFHVSIQNFHINYVDIYGRLSLASAFVRDFLPPGIPMPDFFDMSSIPLADSLLPEIFEIPQFNVDLPNVEVDLLPGILQDIVAMVAALIAQLAQQATEALQKVLQELLDLLRGMLVLEDYNPPRYVGSQDDVEDLDQEEALVSELGEVTRQRLIEKVQAAIQDGFVDAGERIQDVLYVPQADFDNNPPLLEGNATTFTYLEPEFPEFTIPDLIHAFFTLLLAHQWIVEVVIQLVRLVRLKRKYEKDAIPLPEIDFRSRDARNNDDDEDKERQVSAVEMLQLAVIKLFLTPWMALGLVLSPLALVIVVLWFPHVKHSCIDTQDGTIFARNLMAPILINEANLAGNAYHTQAEFRCHRRQRQICQELHTESDRLYRSDLVSLQQYQSRMNESLAFTNLMDRCIDTDLLDQEFTLACCGLEGYTTGDCQDRYGDPDRCPIDNSTIPPSAFRPVGSEYLATGSRSCEQGLSLSLEEAVFDCLHLEDSCVASASCNGVDSEFLRFMAIEADCQVETYVLQCCVFVLVALYHAIVINLASTLVFTGIQRLQWRKLCRCAEHAIQLRTQMTADGKLKKGVANAKERAARIEVAMKRYERVGWMQVGLGSVLFLIWFISFFVLRNALANFVPLSE